MGKKLVYLASYVLVLGLAGNAFSSLLNDPSLVIYYDFEDFGNNLSVLDKSGKGNDATVINTVSGLAGAGIRGSEACQITGNGNYLDLDGANFPAEHIPTTAFTFACWVKPEDTGGTQTVFSADASPHSWCHGGYIRNNQYHIHLGDSNNNYIINAYEGTVEYDAWHHMALTWELVPGEHGGGAMYIDGQLVAEYGNTFVEAPPGVEAADNWRGGARMGYDVDNSWQYNGLLDDFCIFTRALDAGEVLEVMTGLEKQGPAMDPLPEDEAIDIPRDVVLSWTAGPYAETHDVYLGTVFDDVNDADRANPMDVLASEGQDAAAYDPVGLLDFNQTYYWRIDEVNGAPDYGIIKGNVWSFTTEPFAYPVEGIIATSNAVSEASAGPEKMIDGSGLNEADEHSTTASDMWLGTAAGADPVHIQYEFDRVYKLYEMLVWNYNVQFELMLGFGVKDVTVEYSENGTDWTALGDVELSQATARADYTANTTIEFGGVPAKFVRLAVNSGWGPLGQFGLSEVRFLFIPASAREPQPADGDTNVAVGTALNWRAGREAVTHDVYLGTDAEALALIDSVSETSVVPGNLEFGSMYYWRVDEVNEADEISVWPGMVWDFVTQEYAVIDDMESYNDEDNVIYETWIDGWVNGTGSTVGYLQAPFAEQTIVNSGRQSMPLEYNNTDGALYSEASRTWPTAQDWTAGGADSLRLHFQGNADNTPEIFYVALEDNSGNTETVVHSDPAAVLATEWREWTIPLSEFDGVNLAGIVTIYIGLGNRENPTTGSAGLIYIDDIGVGRPAAVE